jgi:hypothetical protein
MRAAESFSGDGYFPRDVKLGLSTGAPGGARGGVGVQPKIFRKRLILLSVFLFFWVGGSAFLPAKR